MKKNHYITIIFFLSLVISTYARQTEVSSASAINKGVWSAGDTIVLQNGTWNNQNISFKAIGTSTNPVVIQAETAGNVILTGSSRISFSGTYIIISGLYFKDGNLSNNDVISFRTSSDETASHCTLKNTTIINYNPSDNTVDSKWVSLYGSNNTVEYCHFENKTNSGTLMVVWLTDGLSANHIITNNYFGYRNANLDANGNEINGQEIIRIGDSSTSMTFANVTVSNNFFEKCNGEIEIVSNKSCGNIYTNNLFLECKGTLTLRHGNNCIVAGNYFIGNDISETGGVRIIGENHKVYNNYFENLRGTNFRAAVCIVRGKEHSALNEYFQVQNATIAYNTFVNCSQAFCVNYSSSSTITLPPVNTTIADNHVYNTSSSYNNVTIDKTNISEMSVNWKNNLMNQGKYTNFSYTSTQIITGKNAKMYLTNTTTPIYEPSTSSALQNYKSDDFPEITDDIRGRERNSTAKLPGASQITGTISKEMPGQNNTGVSFINKNTTLVLQTQNTGLSFSIQNTDIIIQSEDSGIIRLFNLQGKLQAKHIINQNITITIDNIPEGIYLLQFAGTNGTISTKKIFIKN
ncbi:MAG: chondroitinase-B domain-containing protein [Paludibacter sp.]|nr:chondroitinase-B domain-containing protein [Paludibacter sp.]